MIPGIEVQFEFKNGETMSGTSKYDRAPVRAATKQKLSPQEKRVLTLATQGLTNKQIREELGVSKTTVDNYFNSIRDKIVPVEEVWNRDKLIEYALAHPEILK